MTVPDLVAFDLDDTLAPSKSPVPEEVLAGLADLLAVTRVCVISGGRLEQFETQLLARLDLPEASLERLHLMPTCGTRYHRRAGGRWVEVYTEDLTAAERDDAMRVVAEGAVALGLVPERTWGPTVEDRGSQVTYSALGQGAPVEVKKAWDPDGARKERLRAWAQDRLPGLEVRSGGSTSVDVTRRGIDKAYGMTRLSELLGIGLDDMVFVGDRLDEGGNDYPVKALGVRCYPVADHTETPTVIRQVLAL